MKKTLLLFVFIFTTSLGFSQLPHDDIYFRPGKSKPLYQNTTTSFHYNSGWKPYNQHNVSFSISFMDYYSWYYNPYYWYYDSYYYGWDFYSPYYWYRPYYYDWRFGYPYYGWGYYNWGWNYHYYPNYWNNTYYNKNTRYYGPRNTYQQGSTIPRNRPTSTPQYEKPTKGRNKVGTSPKYRYNRPSNYNRSTDYIRIRTNTNNSNQQKYDRRTKSPEYWRDFNNMSRPAPTKQMYQQRTTPNTYNRQQNYKTQPRSTPNTYKTQPRSTPNYKTQPRKR